MVNYCVVKTEFVKVVFRKGTFEYYFHDGTRFFLPTTPVQGDVWGEMFYIHKHKLMPSKINRRFKKNVLDHIHIR